jgi:hypothetical protein
MLSLYGKGCEKVVDESTKVRVSAVSHGIPDEGREGGRKEIRFFLSRSQARTFSKITR